MVETYCFCAQRLGNDLGEPYFTEFIRAEFGPTGSPIHDVLLRIAALPLRHSLTLNFDLSYEEAHSRRGTTCQTITSCDRRAMARFLLEMDDPTYPRHAVSVTLVKKQIANGKEGEDPSLLEFAATEYGRKGKVVATDGVKKDIENIGINKCARKSGFDRKNFIRKLVRGLAVKAIRTRNLYAGWESIKHKIRFDR